MTYHVILLVIISYIILLSLSIVFKYHFIFDGSLFDIPNLIYLLLEINFSLLHC